MNYDVSGSSSATVVDEFESQDGSRAAFWRPRLLRDAAFTVHVPFAFWLIEASRPRRVVELGLGEGVSYFAFCQAVDALGLDAHCVGIDHWRGDRFTPADTDGGSAAYDHNANFYARFSDCLAFDLVDAASLFADGEIDLLHVDVALAPRVIDSLTQDWTPKLSHRAVMLIHGAATRADNAEAAAFLAALRDRHRCLDLDQGAGLTLALVGADQPERLLELVTPPAPPPSGARLIFEHLGRACQLEARRQHDAAEAERRAAEAETAALRIHPWAARNTNGLRTRETWRSEAGSAEAEVDAARAAQHEAELALSKVERALVAELAARKRLQVVLGEVLTYGRDLEKRHLATLESTTWRAMEPVRQAMRLATRRRPAPPFAPRLHKFSLPSIASARRSDPADDESGEPSSKDWIARAFEKAKAAFRTTGVAELEEIAARGGLDAESRRQAARYLALLRAEDDEEAPRIRALAELGAAPFWREGARGGVEAATLRLGLLLGLGRTAEAARLAATPPAGAGADPDFLLLAAGLAPLTSQSGPDRIAAVAAAMRRSAGLGIARDEAGAPAGIDSLRGAETLEKVVNAMKISVIVPAFNCADTIATSLRSISRQTWENLEILVADDASADATPEIVAEMAERDKRIRLIRLAVNGGAYRARNTALSEAQGDLVTCQDADDWSHPERLRRQAQHLKANPHLVANVSHWARATPDLIFERRPFSARVIHFNSSSIMFHRELVLDQAGFWDSVRFGGDTEFWRRLIAIFGEAAVAQLPEMLAIGRIRDGSLSRAAASAYAGGKTGARKFYEHAYSHWHATAPAGALRMPFPLATRPFAVPTVMTEGRSVTGHFDVVLISDFRHMGGTTASNQQELIAQSRAGLRTGVVQVDRYDFNVSRGIHPDIRALIDDGSVEHLVNGDAVTADLAVVRFPPIFNHAQDHLPEVRPRAVRVVVNQPPRRVAGEAPFYSLETCKANVAAYLGQVGDWVPIGPAVRDALAADGEAHQLTPEDWFNIIDVDAWTVPRDSWRAERPVIGRHGRDAAEKWLTKAEDILGAYPDDGSVRVRIMGGADVPISALGRRPANWEVLEFNAQTPRDFLETLDYFVFFPHEGRIEAFGRTVIEAMASGALAILPPVFEPLFGEAAIYCAPAGVGAVVSRFHADRAAYLAQTARAEAVVRARFGFEQHIARVSRAIAAGAETPSLVHG